jgi:hypothetical protein
MRFYMCHTSATQLDATFDNNYTGNTPVEVINEPSMMVGGPADQWWNWDVYFPYNNTDNLLVEVRWNGDAGLGIPMYRTAESVPRRVYANDDNATMGTTSLTGNYIRLYLTPPGGGAVVWDFETGWQDWTHTNGMAFPAGWGVEAATTHSSLPDAGDSTMWVDSDAGGSGFWIQDSALSPVCTPNSGMDWLKYGFYNYGGSGSYVNELHVGIKHSTGGVWTATELALYPSGMTSGPAWDSVDVSAYASADFVQVYFYFDDLNTWGYYAGFDNVSINAAPYVADHDVGCSAVLSPPEGSTAAGDYDVIGRIQNYGNNVETFDAMAVVWDTVGMTQVFSQSVTLTGFPVAGDSNVNFGTVTFNTDSHYYTEIYTMLSGDNDPSNDTASVYSTTALALGDIIFIIDTLSTITGFAGQYGMEFDGTYFYVSSAYSAPGVISVIDTMGNLVWSIPQGTSSLYGMRDLAWDGVYSGPDRIDTLWASDDNGNYKFGLDLVAGTMTSYGSFTGPVLPCRALGWDDDDEWFFTANWDPLYKFSKTNPNIQSVTGPGSVYGSAYDTDDLEGHYVWWFGQTGTYLAYLTQMNPSDMTMTGVGFDVPHTISGGIAGGLCFYEGFRGMDVLFGIIQGEGIYGIYVRDHLTGIEGKPGAAQPLVFGFAPTLATVTKGHVPIAYTTTVPGRVSLKVYDGIGRLVNTLVDTHQPAGEKSVYWNNKDLNQRTLSNGVYFLKLEANGETDVQKLILVR